ncbi:MAG: hypothetical protein DRI54_08685 [Bacteroidetes bacterium]|nr:MAG: hypothetical protein DRI54_08685 [Bacteroidota bacterium]
MKFRNIFWGVVLIFLGVLFILSNLNLIYFDWMHLWRLWPVILVLWGVSILPVHNLIKLSLTILVLGGTVFFMVDQTVEWDDNKHIRIEKWESDESYPIDQTFNIPYDDSVKTVMLDLDIGAGAFIIADSTDDLIDFNKRGTKAKYAYVVKRSEDRAVIKIERDEINIVSGKTSHTVEIKLNKEPVWDFDLDAGAAALDFDLSAFKVNKLDLDGGAAAFELKFGDKYPETFVTIDAGASSIDLQIPDSSGCDLRITAVLSGKSIYGFKKLEHGHYRTENFDETESKIFIEVDAAVSSFSISRY